MLSKLLLLSLFLIAFTGCLITEQKGKGTQNKELKVLPGNWGHIEGMSLAPSSPLYLINKKAGEPYNICLAKYMLEKYPGIDEEIIASANIWAHYIGREILVDITVKDLPRSTKNQNEDQLIDAYYEICGDQTELIIGLGPIGKPNLGKVISPYFYDPDLWNKKRELKVLSFKQALFLHDENSSDFQWKFISFQDFLKLKEPVKADEILNILKSRSEYYYPKLNMQITLPILMHEFGHVWGLCDQYETSNNCDPKFSSLDNEGHILLDDNSIMGKGKNSFKAYLRNDDIDGIRQLSLRKGFNAEYKLTKKEIEFQVPEIEIKNTNILEENFFKIKEDSDQLQANLLFVVSEPYELKVSVLSDAKGWLNYTIDETEKIPYESSNYSLNLPKPDNSKSKIQRIKISLKLLKSGETKNLDLFLSEN